MERANLAKLHAQNVNEASFFCCNVYYPLTDRISIYPRPQNFSPLVYLDTIVAYGLYSWEVICQALHRRQ